MNFFVYMIISNEISSIKTYVGYTNNLEKRLKLHNNSKGAKFTRGKYWNLVYSKKYLTRKNAMRSEFKLKKDRIKRNLIKLKFINSL